MQDKHRLKVLKAFLKQYDVRLHISTSTVDAGKQLQRLVFIYKYKFGDVIITQLTYVSDLSPVDVIFKNFAGKTMTYYASDKEIFIMPDSYEEMEMLISIRGDNV